MAAEAWPTEDLATKAVDAAARDAFERFKEADGGITLDWDDLDAVTKLRFRESVLPIVWAALTSLPDPRYAAWEEGKIAGADDAMYEERGVGPYPDYPHENPYPSGP